MCPSSSTYISCTGQFRLAVLKKSVVLFLPAGGGVEDTSQLGRVHAELYTLYMIIIRIQDIIFIDRE